MYNPYQPMPQRPIYSPPPPIAYSTMPQAGLLDFLPTLTNTLWQFLPVFMMMGMAGAMSAGMVRPVYPEREEAAQEAVGTEEVKE